MSGKQSSRRMMQSSSTWASAAAAPASRCRSSPRRCNAIRSTSPRDCESAKNRPAAPRCADLDNASTAARRRVLAPVPVIFALFPSRPSPAARVCDGSRKRI
ncbi:hypothetical protein VTO73DRAFT_1908 [Trametes versicolor]